MKKVLILLICLIGYQIGCHAQMADEHYYFKNLSVQNGLSQNTVNAILQDRQGFMWFGTSDGLNRFDGKNFKIFRHIPKDSTSLGNNIVRTIFEDERQNLWVGTNRGIYIFNSQQE